MPSRLLVKPTETIDHLIVLKSHTFINAIKRNMQSSDELFLRSLIRQKDYHVEICIKRKNVPLIDGLS